MRVGIVTTKPIAPATGSSVRNYYLVKAIQNNYQVTTFTPTIPRTLKNSSVYKDALIYKFIEFSLTRKFLTLLTQRFAYVERLRKAIFPNKINEIIKELSIIQLQELDSFFVFEKLLKTYSGIAILDAHNIDYIRLKGEFSEGNKLKKILSILLLKSFKKIEINVLKSVDHILVCSEIDKAYYAKYVSKKKITVIPNGVDTTKFKPYYNAGGESLFFMGTLSYNPNAEGLKYFLYNIYPIIKKHFPHISITVSGKDAPVWLQQISKKDITIKLLGFVSDIKPHIRKATVCICPIYSGSGTRVKLLEYMAMGKAIVSTNKGAEGIDIMNNKHMLLVDTAEDFSKAVVKLILNRKKREILGMNSRILVEEKYDWKIIQKKLMNVYKNLENI